MQLHDCWDVEVIEIEVVLLAVNTQIWTPIEAFPMFGMDLRHASLGTRPVPSRATCRL